MSVVTTRILVEIIARILRANERVKLGGGDQPTPGVRQGSMRQLKRHDHQRDSDGSGETE